MSEHKTIICECGHPAHADYHIWNGKQLLPVCESCWTDPENIVLEACVGFAGNDHQSLEEGLRVELGFRHLEWSHELQALCDKRYCEWYMEYR